MTGSEWEGGHERSTRWDIRSRDTRIATAPYVDTLPTRLYENFFNIKLIIFSILLNKISH